METIENIYASKFREYDDIQAARGCNQHKHVPGCDEQNGAPNSDSPTPTQPHNKGKKKQKVNEVKIKADNSGGANLLILPNGDVLQVTENDLRNFKNNTTFSAFHVNKDGTYGGTPEGGLMIGATLDEALGRFPLSESAKKDVTDFFENNKQNGALRFYRLKLGM